MSKNKRLSESTLDSIDRMADVARRREGQLSVGVDYLRSMTAEIRRHRAAALSAADRESLVQMRAWMSGAIDDRNPSVVSALAVLDRLLATHDATSGGEE